MSELYIDFYELVDRPFELTPDPRYVYLSAHHKEALAHLKYGVEERKGFIQLTGEVGTGKTTMLDVLISELDASTAVAKLSHTTVNEVDLLRLIARGFGIDTNSGSKAVLLDLLRERLSSWSKEGRNAVVVVDEAQNLDLPALEEIRLLSNLKVNGRLGLQIILAGQPELRDKLDRSELRQLRQRIGIKYHLTPLSRQETADYIAHRMAVAGGQEETFHPRAVEAIYEHSQGVPRVVNMVCDRALLVGYAENRRTIAPDLVEAAIEALDGTPVVVTAQREDIRSEPEEQGDAPRRRSRVRWAVPLVSAVALVALAVGAVLVFEEGPGRPAADEAEAVAAPVADEPDPDAYSSADAEGGQDDMIAAGEGASETGPVPADVDVEPQPTPVDGEADGGMAETWMPAEEGGAPDGPARAFADLDSGYLVVAASSRDASAASRKAEEFRSIGTEAVLWTVDLGERGVWHRIVLTPGYGSLEEATEALERLQSMGYEDAWIVRQ